MQLKSESKHQQVGDYVFKIKNTWCRIVFERKSVQDLYSTLFMTSAGGEKNRDRLKREIQRFYDDERFNNSKKLRREQCTGSFIVICEGTYQEYLNYLAPRKACKYCNHWTENVGIEMKKGVGICNKTTRYPPITNAKEECWQFSEKEDIGKRISKLLNAKKASIDSLNSMPQVQVLFCESREDMAERIESIVKLWCFHNFEEILQSMG
jgi:hypothetical protein